MTGTTSLDDVIAEVERLLGDVDAAADHSGDTAAAAVAARLRRSVLRPLRSVREAGVALHIVGDEPVVGSVDDRLWALAQSVTRLMTVPGAPMQLREAAAALQSMVCTSSADAGRRERLSALQELLPQAIVTLRNGPLLLTNVERLSDWLGLPLPVHPQMALCRCGRSDIKPLCDAACVDAGFSDAKDARRVPDRLDTYVGEVVVTDNRGLCAHSGFCTDRLPSVFHTGGEPFVTAGGARMDEIIHTVRACPSGALGWALAVGDASHADQVRDPAVEVSKDGPYRVTGGIPLLDSDGEPVARNAGASTEHYSLCRCGHSLNKPFCSGMHWYVDFVDPQRSAQPSLFEWAGGLPVLTRMARIFFERLVPDDAVLASRFANDTASAPERFAAWLGDGLGGPASAAFDAAAAPLSDEERTHWVAAMHQAAAIVKLPDDAPFRDAFAAYLDAASRSGFAGPPPRAGWGAGGPPRDVSGDVAAAAPTTATVALPGADEVVTFDDHVKRLFRDKDRDSMRFAFDLWSCADVSANAQDILDRVGNGSMPCDAPWPAAWVDVLRRWIDGGMPESAASAAAEATTPARQAADAADAAANEAITGRLGRALHLRSAAPLQERALVIEHREPLIYMLCAAAELEHALMCEYLFAAFSLKRSVDEGLTAEQLAAVQRWRSTLMLVAKQEMLHLAINCNLVTSLGASPHLSRPNLPQPAKHYPPGVRLTLLPFNEQSLRHFLFLERPEGMDIDDADGLAAADAALPVMGEEEIAPHLQEFQTVGHLYRSIEAGFRHLADKFGEEQLFLGPRESQASGELFGWKQLQPIGSCDDAVRAIEAIVEQGEGPRGDWRNAHFGRFLSVLNEYTEMMEANPGLEVTRPVLPVLVRPPETGEAADLISDADTARVADLCNVGYEVLLQVLYRLMCHVDESDAQIRTLAGVAVALMVDVIEPLADVLTTLPVGPEHPGRTAGATFELFYQPDYLLPHRRAAWLVMAEHLRDAAVLADGEASRDGRFRPVAQALRAQAEVLQASAA